MKQPKTDFIGLSRAEALGYGKAHTLQMAILRGKLKGLKVARNWITTEKWLKEASYTTTLVKQNPQPEPGDDVAS